jgi:hypothetical protein
VEGREKQTGEVAASCPFFQERFLNLQAFEWA